jgi:DNA-binding MurR/RpiR family transcriptional regulator
MVNGKLMQFLENCEEGSTQQRIAGFAASHLDEIPGMTADEMAEACGVSKTTLMSFVRALGYDGYVSFRNACLQEEKDETPDYSTDGSLFDRTRSLAENIDRMTERKLENIRFCMDRLGQDQMRRVANDVLKSRRVYIFAQGGTRPLAHLLSTELKINGKEVVITDANLQENYNPGKDDLFVFLSIIGQSFKEHPDLMERVNRYHTNKWLITCNQEIDFQGHRWVIPVREKEFSEFVIRHALDLLFAYIELQD